jgi:hypothetical protein
MTKAAQIVAVQSSDAHGFRWKWRSPDDGNQSKNTFLYFFDCLQDARSAGYTVALGRSSPRDQERPA